MSLILLVNAHSSGRRARHRVWPFLALLPFLLLAACTSPEQKEAQHLERAIALYEEGDDQRAMVELRNVLNVNSKNADALFHVGLIHERAGRLRPAYEAFQQAVAERPEFVTAQVRLGNLALGGNQLDVVERAVEAIEAAEPENPDGLALKGALLLNLGNLEGAREAAEAALVKAADVGKASIVLVGALLKEGRRNAAFERLDEALTRAPENADLLMFKLLLQEQMGDHEATVETFARLLEVDPSQTNYHLAFAQYWQQHGDAAQAEAALRAAMAQASETTEIAADLARLVHRTRGADAAIVTVRELVERRPDNMALRLLLADLYAQQQHSTDAEAVLQAIIERAESQESVSSARVRLARLKQAAGELAAAEALVAEVLAEDPGHSDALVLAGRIALNDDRVDDAIRSARTALRQSPEFPPALRLVADAHERKGEIDFAIDALVTLLSIDAQDTRSAQQLAELLASRGDLGAASKIWDRVVATAPDPSDALRARALISIGQSNFNAAQADIVRLLESPDQQATAALLRGHLAVAQGRLEEGRQWFERAETIAPAEPGPMVAMTHSFVVEDMIPEAIAYLEERTRKQPDDAPSFNLKGEMLARAGRLEAAELAWAEALRLQPTSIISYRRLGQARLAAGRLDEGFATYAAAVEKAPEDAELLFELGRAYETNRRHDDALATYERLAELAPSNDVAVNNFAAMVADFRYEDPQSLDRALALADRFRASDNASFLDTLGWLHYRKGDFAVAITFLDRAVALAPDHPVLRYHLGMALDASGQPEQALLHLERAVPHGADYHGIEEARATLAKIQKQLADTERQRTPMNPAG